MFLTHSSRGVERYTCRLESGSVCVLWITTLFITWTVKWSYFTAVLNRIQTCDHCLLLLQLNKKFLGSTLVFIYVLAWPWQARELTQLPGRMKNKSMLTSSQATQTQPCTISTITHIQPPNQPSRIQYSNNWGSKPVHLLSPMLHIATTSDA